MNSNMTDEKKNLDHSIFWPSLIVTLLISIPLIAIPDWGNKVVNSAFAFCTGTFGWAFLVAAVFCLIFCLWLAFGKYGNVKLGGPNDTPEFSTFSWNAMIFCTTMGVGMMIWPCIEPLQYLVGPPFGIEPHSNMAVEWAHMYGHFHWGPMAYALYPPFIVAIAYVIHVRKTSRLRLSEGCRGVLGKYTDGILGKVIDVIMMFGVLGGVGTSLGLAVPIVSTEAGELFGIPDTMMVKIGILAIWTLIFGFSVYRGLNKGIKVLSDINVYIALAFLAFMFLVGPKLYILKMEINSLGLLIHNFPRMSLWTDPVNNSGFPEGWTIFFWAWIFAYGPLMGIFVARISKGRTIKQVVLSVVTWIPVGAYLFFAIWGGYSLYLETSGTVPVTEILEKSGQYMALVATIKALPMSNILLLAHMILCLIFVATTLDSAAYTLASVCTKELSGNDQPTRWNRILWAIVLAVLAIGLLAVGGLTAVQLSSIVGALPIIVICILLSISTVRMLNEDFGEVLKPKIYTVDYSQRQQEYPYQYESSKEKANTTSL